MIPRKHVLSIVIVILSSTHAQAFPENIRHGYINCTACHVSPTGGGITTEYGRELSKEILSTWGKDGEQKFAYGLVHPPSWLNLGGDYRSIYVYKDSVFATQGKSILMQADLEGAATVGRFVLDTTAGYREAPLGTLNPSLGDHLISRRHYVLYHLSDEWSLRAGRFFPAFGVQVPDHVIVTKRGLGWDEGRETYNLEAGWISEKWNIYGTAIFGRPDAPAPKRETGFATTAAYAPWETGKIGLSYYFGDLPNDGTGLYGTRHLVGPFAILGITRRITFLSEFDFQISNQRSPGQTVSGAVNYQKFSYEIKQGLWANLTQEWSRLAFSNEATLANQYGVGIQWFPRPHFELNVAWQKNRIVAVAPTYSDFAWIMLHFYP